MQAVKLSGEVLGGRIYKACGYPGGSKDGDSQVFVTLVMTAGWENILLREAGASADKKVQNSHIF
jgi:hypothetical protein